MGNKLLPLSKAIVWLKEQNPECYISRGLIEQGIASHQIGFVPIGNRKLVDVDKVQIYLSTVCEPKGQGSSKTSSR